MSDSLPLWRVVSILIGAFVALNPNILLACATPVRLQLSHLVHADLVFHGWFVSTTAMDKDAREPATITLEVVETYKGPHRKKWTLEIAVPRFPTPEVWVGAKRSRSMVVAAVGPIGNAPELAHSRIIRGQWRPDLFGVARRNCAPHMLFDFTPFFERRVKSILSSSAIHKRVILAQFFDFYPNRQSLIDASVVANRRFDEMDRDGNGLSVEDAEAIINGRMAKAKLQRIRIFKRYDADKNGVVTITELRRLTKRLNLKRRERFFNKLTEGVLAADSDGDQMVTSDEFFNHHVHESKFLDTSKIHKQISMIVEMFDQDGDQRLSKSELSAALRENHRLPGDQRKLLFQKRQR